MRIVAPLLCFAIVLSSNVFAAGSNSADHSGHQMDDHNIERDELGRRLYGQDHQLTPEMIQELRAKIPQYQSVTDAHIAMHMKMMGSNYTWYLSDAGLNGSQGVLLLSHSARASDPRIKASVEKFAEVYPMAMAPGMAMMMSNHIQLALDDLEAAGAETIVVVPLVSTRYNTLLRQWHYIFGKQDNAEYVAVPRVTSDARILFADPPGDSPWIAEILVDHALELSRDPANELVIIAAHGPQFEADNQKVQAELQNLGDMVKDEVNFSQVLGFSLQDDAPAEVRAANVARLRDTVAAANAAGKRVLVVTNLMGSRSIQGSLRTDLKGLDYEFNPKGISEHPTFANDWLANTIVDTLAAASQPL